MTSREKLLVADQFADSRERLLGVVRGLTPEQWAFRPGQGRWSIGECLEHVVRVENRVIGLIGKKLKEPAEAPKPPDSAAEKEAALMKLVPDRSARREAPEPVRPSGEWPEAAALLAQFEKTRSGTTQFVAGIGADLRIHFLPHPAFGELDCYQWLLVLGLHGARHACVKWKKSSADPAFPQRPRQALLVSPIRFAS